MRIGFGELLVVFIVALLVLGPDKMPEYARRLGVMLRGFRDATSDATKDIRENVIEPLNEAQRPLREAMEPLQEIKEDMDHNANDIKRSLYSATTAVPTKKVLRKDEYTGEIKEVPLEEPAAPSGEDAALTEQGLETSFGTTAPAGAEQASAVELAAAEKDGTPAAPAAPNATTAKENTPVSV
jgi:sec-independent protein translocase protein TatB